MELSILLMEQIAKLFIMIFMGYAVVKMGLLKDEDSKVLSTLVLYLIVPCVILNAFQVDYTPEKVSGLELACIASLLSPRVPLERRNGRCQCIRYGARRLQRYL